MDPRKFWTMCRIHDWFYHMSDDPSVYREGADRESDILAIAEKSPAHRAVYEAWRAYHFESGEKPSEPKEKD